MMNTKYILHLKHLLDKKFNSVNYNHTLSAIFDNNNDRDIFVMGDIHGDLLLLIKLFYLSNTIKILHFSSIKSYVNHITTHFEYDELINTYIPFLNKTIQWTGGDSYIVQVGDQIDSCRPPSHDDFACHKLSSIDDHPNDLKILFFFDVIHQKAILSGGRVMSTLGNHEIFNVLGNDSDYRYVSRQNLLYANKSSDNTNKNTSYSSLIRGRKKLFTPGSHMANYLGYTRYPAIKIGQHLFVHAGFLNSMIDILNLTSIQSINDINIIIKCWLLNIPINDEYINNILNILIGKNLTNIHLFMDYLQCYYIYLTQLLQKMILNIK